MKLIQTEEEHFVNLNKGFNGERDKGLFIMVGVDVSNGDTMMCKPYDLLDHDFHIEVLKERPPIKVIVASDEFLRDSTKIKSLLTFTFNNN